MGTYSPCLVDRKRHFDVADVFPAIDYHGHEVLEHNT